MKDIMDSEFIKRNSIDPELVSVGDWSNRIMFHGTSKTGALSIKNHGILQSKSTKGYFGRGFYMTSDYDLAKNNYADFAEEGETGDIVVIKIKSHARILDLRTENDFLLYAKVTRNGSILGNDNLDNIMIQNGIDGLFDRSFGGVVIYNPKAVEVMS
jgi:hypothetical protein